MLTTYPDLAPGVMATLLDWCGPQGALSPRREMGPAYPLGTHTLAELYAADILVSPVADARALAPDVAESLRVVAEPRQVVRLRAWTRAGVTAESSLYFPDEIRDGRGAILNLAGEAYRLTRPADGLTIVDLLQTMLPDGPDAPETPAFLLRATPPVMGVLMGTADLVRRRSAGGRGSVVPQDAILRYVRERWLEGGFDSLLSFVAPVAEVADPPSVLELVNGLDELTAHGLLFRTQTREFAVGPGAEPISTLGATMTGGLSWRRESCEGTERVTAARLCLFGAGGRVICLTRMADQSLLVTAETVGRLADFLSTELAGGHQLSGRTAIQEDRTLPAPASTAATNPAASTTASPPRSAAVFVNRAWPIGVTALVLGIAVASVPIEAAADAVDLAPHVLALLVITPIVLLTLSWTRPLPWLRAGLYALAGCVGTVAVSGLMWRDAARNAGVLSLVAVILTAAIAGADALVYRLRRASSRS